jgi:hypothetical protein
MRGNIEKKPGNNLEKTNEKTSADSACIFPFFRKKSRMSDILSAAPELYII